MSMALAAALALSLSAQAATPDARKLKGTGSSQDGADIILRNSMLTFTKKNGETTARLVIQVPSGKKQLSSAMTDMPDKSLNFELQMATSDMQLIATCANVADSGLSCTGTWEANGTKRNVTISS